MAVLEVANGASFAGARSIGLAAGSIFVIRGTGLGPAALVSGVPPYTKRLPDSSGGSRVVFHNVLTGRGLDALLTHSSSGKVGGIVPLLPPGRYVARVIYQGESASSDPFRIVRSAPGLFTFAMTGAGPGAMQNYEPSGAVSLNGLTRPALPGGYLIVWGTGLGVPNGWFYPTASTDDAGVRVALGSAWIEPSYAGPAPGLPGVDQINVSLPSDFAEKGCYIPLQVVANGIRSNTVAVSVSELPGTCEHPLGFSTEVLERLSAGGRVALGEVSVTRTAYRRIPEKSSPGLPPWAVEFPSIVLGSAAIRFSRADALGVFPSSGLQVTGETGCRPSNVGERSFFGWVDVGSFPLLPLDAGPRIRVTDPFGQTFELDRFTATGGDYQAALILGGDQGGLWRFGGIGGADVGPFEAEISLPSALNYNFPGTVDLKQPLEVSWPTEDLEEFEGVTVELGVQVTVQDDEFSSTTSERTISCWAPAVAGRLTFPVEILQTLPSTNNGSGSIEFVLDSKPVTFTATGLDYGIGRASVSDSWSIKVK